MESGSPAEREPPILEDAPRSPGEPSSSAGTARQLLSGQDRAACHRPPRANPIGGRGMRASRQRTKLAPATLRAPTGSIGRNPQNTLDEIRQNPLISPSEPREGELNGPVGEITPTM